MIIDIKDDMDLAKIADSGQCFRWEEAEEGAYRILARDRALYLIHAGEDRFEAECTDEEFASVWAGYLDLAEDYRAVRARIDAEEDPYLAAAAEAEKGIRILRQDPWEVLISFIISQNKNIPGIKRCIRLLAEAAGERRTDSRGNDYYAFPEAEGILALGEDGLTACRLGYRAGYVYEAAKAQAEGMLDWPSLAALPSEEAIAELTNLKGVGPKVAACIVLFGLHQIDAFPLDVWMKRVLKEEYPEGFPYSRYTPYCGIYQQYLFAYSRSRASRLHS